MNILVTAGNTRTMIDRVRCITNIFTGRTGANIAAEASGRGHCVTLLTSHPEVLPPTPGLTVRAYDTFEGLEALMAEEVGGGGFDAVIHSAAVSDYHVAGVYAASDLLARRASEGPAATEDAQPVTDLLARRASEGPAASADTQSVTGGGEPTLPPLDGLAPRSRVGLTDASAGKVKSSLAELWICLTPAPKLVDKVRTDWGFHGVLVKFKLEVGVSEAELKQIAERSRQQSQADLMSANTLDGAAEWALVGAETYTKVPRANLAAEIVTRVEKLHGIQRA